MSIDPVDRLIVNAIIGNIRQVVTLDDDDFEDITDEEIAEFDALPDLEMTPEREACMVARGMEIFKWFVYKQECERRGLPCVDVYEWQNLSIKPKVEP